MKVKMDSIQIPDLVNILIQDGGLIRNWTRFKDSLGLGGDPDFVSLTVRYDVGAMTAYELMSEILTRWRSVKGQEATIAKLSETLEGLHFNFTADKIQIFNIPSARNLKIYFEIDDATWNFVGRLKEIEELQTWFVGQRRPILKIIGMGGIGKSELVRKFANTLKNEVSCFWLNGDSPESLKYSIVQVATSLAVSTTVNNQPKDSLELFSEIISAIKQNNELKILIIIDNVDAENPDVHLILKKCCKLRCFAVVTSRNSGVVADAGETLNLDILDTKDAHTFVRDSLDEESDDDISHLCILLNNFPLALQQAVAFIKHQQFSGLEGKSFKIPDYLKIYEKNKVKALAFPLNKIEHEYGLTTLVTWNTSLQQVQKNGETGTIAIKLLNFISYFDANGIDFEFLKNVDRARISDEDERDDDIYEEAILLLKSYSLLKCENKLISIHRLVQEVTRVNCRISNLEEALLRQLVKSIVLIFNKLKQLDMPHVLRVSKHVISHDEIVRVFSSFPLLTILALRDLSLYKEMLDFANLSYRRLSKILGEKHSETLSVKSQAADALRYNGKYEEALQKLTVVEEEQRSVFGEEDPTTLLTGHNLASLLFLLDKNDEALETFKRLLKSMKKVFGGNHQQTIATKGCMANVLSEQGKYREAMELHEEVLEWKKTELGEEDPETLITRHNIGHCLYSQKEFLKARGIFEEVLELKLKVLGEEHSSTLDTKYTLAYTLVSLGECEEGLRMLKEVLASMEKVLGSEHPHTINTILNIDDISRRRR